MLNHKSPPVSEGGEASGGVPTPSEEEALGYSTEFWSLVSPSAEHDHRRHHDHDEAKEDFCSCCDHDHWSAPGLLLYKWNNETHSVWYFVNQSYHKDKEVFNSYGTDLCTEFLMHYGFVAGNSLILAIPLDLPEALEAEPKDIQGNKKMLFQTLNINFVFFEYHKGSIPPSLMAALRIYKMTFADLNLIEDVNSPRHI
eukprot:TRINITY_DN1288_c0_g2_i4.p1 TRINITY_DN1288_c0_g2~~TRINITY_DN1288_c0_g2_i4.p1  ORF type:complete len:198 (+),score=32.94 TRINITY_DN1288_c0_g2_i4:380-973(+)